MKKIVWTKSAIRDLRRIYEYIASDSQFYAATMVEEIFESIERLELFPKLGHVVPEIKRESVRELIMGSYRIIYDLKNGFVRILVVIHGAKRLKKQRT